MKKNMKILLSFSLFFIVANTKISADNEKTKNDISEELISEESELDFHVIEPEIVSEDTDEEIETGESELTENNIEIEEISVEIVEANENPLDEVVSTIVSRGENGNTTWELDSDGTLTVIPKLNTDGKIFSPVGASLDRNIVKTIEVNEGVRLPDNAVSTFSKFPELEKIHFVNMDTSNVKSMSDLFSNNPKLVNINIENWNVSNVVNMSRMFSNATSLKTLDVSQWNTCNVSHLSEMFNQAKSLTDIDVSQWDTGNVKSTKKCLTVQKV